MKEKGSAGAETDNVEWIGYNREIAENSKSEKRQSGE
jgi:hypothetical protein